MKKILSEELFIQINNTSQPFYYDVQSQLENKFHKLIHWAVVAKNLDSAKISVVYEK